MSYYLKCKWHDFLLLFEGKFWIICVNDLKGKKPEWKYVFPKLEDVSVFEDCAQHENKAWCHTACSRADNWAIMKYK